MQVTAGAFGEPLPMNPQLVLAPALTTPFQLTLDAVTDVVPLTVAFQDCVSAVPAGNVHATRHPLIFEAPAVIVTSPCQPPVHVLTTLMDDEHPPDCCGVVVVVLVVVVPG